MQQKPIRIAQVIGKANLSGVDTVVMNYYRNIDRSKVQFDFIIDGYLDTPIDHEIEALGGKIYKVEPYEKNILKSMHQCYSIFKANNYPLVHCHMNTLSLFPLFEAWRAGIPVRIAHSHSTTAKGEGKRAVLKYALRPFAKLFPTNFCACSEYAGRWLFGDRLYDRGKVHLVKNAIDLDNFRFNPEVREQMRTKLGINNRFVVGHVGRFVYSKNHNFLIDVFNEVHKRNPDSVLLLVGDGTLKEQIRQKVDRLGLSDSVMFLGLRKDVTDLYQAMDVSVLPSNYEGFGMVALEAQASGLPVIVSEYVPKDTQVTDLLSYMHLTQPIGKWADKILTYEKYCRPLDIKDRFQKAGFDIFDAGKDLTKWYLKIAASSPTRMFP